MGDFKTRYDDSYRKTLNCLQGAWSHSCRDTGARSGVFIDGNYFDLTVICKQHFVRASTEIYGLSLNSLQYWASMNRPTTRFTHLRYTAVKKWKKVWWVLIITKWMKNGRKWKDETNPYSKTSWAHSEPIQLQISTIGHVIWPWHWNQDRVHPRLNQTMPILGLLAQHVY